MPSPPARLAAALRRFLRLRARARLALDLDTCRQERDRWRHNADSYEQELTGVRLERAHLLAWLAALHPSSAVLTERDADGGPVLSLRAGEHTLFWPLAPAELPLFAHVPYAAPAPREEAHDRAARIREHTRLLAVEDMLTCAERQQHPY